MKTETLQLFVDVMRAGDFASVARQRDVDPSSVSRAIGALERALGCRLFARTTRRFQPTEAGRIFFGQVEPLLRELDMAAARARDVNTRPAGVLRVTASVAFGCEVLAPLVGELRRRYPDLELDVVLSDAQADLLAERIDVAVRLGPPPPPGLPCVRLMPVRHRVCASPAYVREHGPVDEPEWLAERDCVRFPFEGFSDRWRFRDRDGGIVDVDVGGRLVISNALALKRCVMDGLGPGLLADWMIAKALAAGDLVDLLPWHDVTATTFDTAAWLVYPERTYLPLKVRIFAEFLSRRLQTPVI